MDNPISLDPDSLSESLFDSEVRSSARVAPQFGGFFAGEDVTADLGVLCSSVYGKLDVAGPW